MYIEHKDYLDFDDVLIKPTKTNIKSRSEVDLSINNCTDLIDNCIPIIASNMDTVGCFTMAKKLSSFGLMTCLHKYYSAQEYINFFENIDKSKIFYSVGVSNNDIEKLRKVYEFCGIKNVCLDVANAYIPQVLDTVNKIKEIVLESIIMVGNVATPDIIEDFAKNKISILKVGIGGGGVCTTRITAGVGVPQFSCITDCVLEAKRNNIKICSDGGCRTPADIVKSFAGGASMVMIGSLLAGYDECEGEWEYGYESKILENGVPQFTGEKVKKNLKFYGMSSRDAMEKYNGEVAEYRASEGKCVQVPYKGKVDDFIRQVLGGLRSCCSYTNSKTLKELHNNAIFIRVSNTHNNYFG